MAVQTPAERREDARRLCRYLADEVIDELIKNPRPPRMTPEPAQIHFILLQVRDEPVAQAPVHLAKAIDIIQRRSGLVSDVMSSMVLAIFGFPVGEDPERHRDQRTKSVARLVTELDPDIRLVYGTADGLVGTFGSQQHFHYGPLLPNFARYLGALTALEFGQSAEAPAT